MHDAIDLVRGDAGLAVAVGEVERRSSDLARCTDGLDLSGVVDVNGGRFLVERLAGRGVVRALNVSRDGQTRAHPGRSKRARVVEGRRTERLLLLLGCR